jgi:hypothetical protein
MKARRPVSTVTDYRKAPPTAGPARTTGAPAGATRGGSVTSTVDRPNNADAHDREARALGKQTLIAAAEDLCRRILPARPAYKTDEGREAAWIMGRKAALLREIRRRGLTSSDRMP